MAVIYSSQAQNTKPAYWTSSFQSFLLGIINKKNNEVSHEDFVKDMKQWKAKVKQSM